MALRIGSDALAQWWPHRNPHPKSDPSEPLGRVRLHRQGHAPAIAALSRPFSPSIYWLAVVASTTVGTATADFFDRSLGIGYTGGSSILLACVLCSLAVWYLTLGSINVHTVARPRAIGGSSADAIGRAAEFYSYTARCVGQS
ncbi:MAG TPA: hypothetical protein VMM15_17720 [Bradyrhizobium sp.]|nr:hypothetical protein [Bradyrhizobium sp.]